MDLLPIRGGCKDDAELCLDILLESLKEDGCINTGNDCSYDDTLYSFVDKSLSYCTSK